MLLNNTPLIPKVSFRFAELASTNDAAIAAVNGPEPPPSGSVFWADAQTAGRGQGRNQWHATPNANLSLSIVLYPDHLTVDRLFALTQVSALTVMETVKSQLPDPLAATVRVKWPNDVYVGDRKIAGILVQNGLRGNRIAWSVIGIGLNVNETDFPEELRITATSLKLLSGQELDRERVGERLFQYFSEYYALTDARRAGDLKIHYEQHLYLRGVMSPFLEISSGRKILGTILGVDERGRLRLVDAEEEEHHFALREIRFG